MKKSILSFSFKTSFAIALLAALSVTSCQNKQQQNTSAQEQSKVIPPENEEEENEKYSGPLERELLEIEKTKDPALGYVPKDRLWNAIQYTEFQKQTYRGNSLLSGIWQERGPIFDSVGPSNGNFRGNVPTGGYASGRMLSILVDAADPTGNTVFIGAADGGLWKCTNFLIPNTTLTSPPLNWVPVNDNFDNLAVTSICQDPTNPDIIYFSTGEATGNFGSVSGKGVWKSIDHGATFSLLPSSVNFVNTFKILCDGFGNIYLASRAAAGIFRSTNGGGSWTNITPLGSVTICTDVELSTTGRLHVSLGYGGSGTANLAYRYTDDPTGVTNITWNSGTGLPATGGRIELAVKADTLYAVPTANGGVAPSSYRSFNGGDTWVRNNPVNYTTALANGQAWYDLTLAINPDDATQIIIGGVDAWKSVDTGQTITRSTAWVGINSLPYVHADHHFIQWYRTSGEAGSENRVLIGSDGGAFLSRNGGLTYVDRNNRLAIKQFYSIAIHPTLPNYLLAGAQDNGSHQFKNPGLSYSIEVTGGDGAYVDIDQVNPQYQFTSFVYNQYRRSTNGGANWSAVNLNNSSGRFINPFVYDGVGQKFYACDNTGTIRRWENPTFGSTSTVITVPAISGSISAAFAVGKQTPNRLYVGTGGVGKLVRIDSADVVDNTNVGVNTTDITGPWTVGYINSIALGSTDQNIAISMTNFGIDNVWVTTNGGTTWATIDGNLPDMPIRSIIFNPYNNDQLIVGTEAGVYTTRDVNGSATVWSVSPGFPTVRTDMLKVRASDGLVAAATHGRGVFTTTISQALPIHNVTLRGTPSGDGIALLNWTTAGETARTRYILQYSTDGVSFNKISELPYNIKQFRHSFQATTGYYRIMAVEPNQAAVFSNIVAIQNNGKLKGLQVKVLPNPVSNAGASFVVSSSEAGKFSWTLFDMQGRTLQNGNGVLVAGGSQSQPINHSKLATGMYRIRLIQGNQTSVIAFMKQ